MARRHIGTRKFERGENAGFGQAGEFGQAFLQTAESGEVAPQNPAHLAVAKPAQFAHERRFLPALGQGFLREAGEFSLLQRPGKPVAGQKAGEDCGTAREAARCERRTGQYAAERFDDFFALKQRRQRLVLPQRRQRLVDAFKQKFGNGERDGVHFVHRLLVCGQE